MVNTAMTDTALALRAHAWRLQLLLFRVWTLILQEHILPLDMVDSDGTNLVSMAIMGSIGREDKEECVRLLVKRIGVWGQDSGE